MSVEYLKKASHTSASGESDTRDTVAAMLAEIEAGGEAAALDYARRLDRWEGEAVVSREAIAAAAERLPQQHQGRYPLRLSAGTALRRGPA